MNGINSNSPVVTTNTGAAGATSSASEPDAASSGTGQDLIKDFGDLLDAMKSNVVDVYTAALAKYTEYLKDMADLKVTIANSVKADPNDPNYVLISSDQIQAEIAALTSKWGGGSPLFVSKATGAEGLAEAKRWATEMGLPESCIAYNKDDPNGHVELRVDMSTLMGVFALYPIGNSNNQQTRLSVQQYQQITSAQDALFQSDTNKAQVLTEKTNNQISNMQALFNMVSAICTQMQQIASQMH